LPLKTSSAKAWVEAWADRARGDAMAADRTHWRQFGSRLQRALDHGGVAFMRHRTVPSARQPEHRTPGFCAITLDTQLTAAFRTTAHQAYGTDANDLLLAALQAGVQAWSDNTALLVDLEGHGRDALSDTVDLSRTIGWFTSIYPVLLEAPGVEEPGALIKRVKQTLREVPDKGAGFGVLRYMDGGADDTTRSALSALAPSPLLFTYLGSLDAVAGSSPLYAGAIEPAPGIRSARQRRTHLFDVCAYVSAGQLTIDCTFEGGDMVEESIGRLMENIKESLAMLIRHCCSDDAGGLTPSDVPELDLDQEGLDALLEEVAALDS